MGVEVLYDNLTSLATGSPTGSLGSFGSSGGSFVETDAHACTVSVRMHKDFLL